MNAPQRAKGLWRFLSNILSLLGADAVDRATSFIVYVGVARFLGALEFGQLVLAVSLFQLFLRFSGLGLRDLLTREVAKDRSLTGKYLGNAGALIFGATLVASAAIVALVFILDYSADTARVILLLFVGLFPYSIRQATEAAFIAWERTRYIALVNIPVHFIQTGIALWLTISGHSVVIVALTMVGAYSAMASLQWVVLARTTGMEGLRFDFAFSKTLLKAATPFLGMQGSIALTASINVLALSKFVGEVGVGVYSAATQLLVPLVLATESTASVLFPIMVRRSKDGIDSLRRITYQATEFTIALIFPAVVLIAALGSTLLAAIYGTGAEYDQSIRVLQFIVWVSLGRGITAVFARVLLTSGGEKRLLGLLVIRAITQVIASMILIWQFGVMGAAYAAVVVGSVNAMLHYAAVTQSLPRFNLLGVIWRPGVAAVAMGVALIALTDANEFIQLLAASVTYLGVLASLIAGSPGGFRRLWAQET